MIVGVGRARHGKMMQAETPTERETGREEDSRAGVKQKSSAIISVIN